MQPALEWCFEFSVISGYSKTQHRRLADDLHMAAVGWAEEREFGIGGGFCMLEAASGSASKHRFGLTATRDYQLISPEEAESLFQFLQGYSQNRGVDMIGEWRQFRVEEI